MASQTFGTMKSEGSARARLQIEALEPRVLLSVAFAVQADGDDHLYRIDTETGTAVDVGAVGFTGVRGLAFHPTLGVLYGVDDTTDQLITIDTTTGAGTAVGALGVDVSGTGLAFDYDGKLYMTSTSTNNLYIVNPNTGAAAQVGAAGALGQAVTGLAFGPTAGPITGTHFLYGLGDSAANNLVTIDTTTGVATAVGPLTGVTITGGGGLDFYNGFLFGIEDGGKVFTVNQATGAASAESTTLTGFASLAFEPVADLVMTYYVRPSDTIGTDNGVVFEGEVWNFGPSPAVDVRATARIYGFSSPEISILSGAMSVTGSGGVITQFAVTTGTIASGTNALIATFATNFVDVGGVMRFRFRAQTVQSGALFSVASVSSATADAGTANNSAEFQLLVLPNIYVDDAGNLIIRDVASEGRDDDLTLTLNGNGDLVVTDPVHTLTQAIAAGSGGLQTVGSSPANSLTVDLSGVSRIIIETGLGNDRVTIDNTNGLLPNILFNGGDGFDTLTLVGPADSVTHSFGPAADQGSIVQTAGANTQTILYTGLEPIVDLVVAATLTVNGTNADNAINYSQGSVATRGLVSVDDFETIEFSNKTNLVINGLAGSDTIHLNNPSTPTGLASITVNGGDPTGSDTLIVNGIAGATDQLRHLPTGLGAGTVFNDGPAQPNVPFTGIEHLRLVVHAADGDGVRLDGTVGNDLIEYFQGPGDSGMFIGTMDANNATGGGPFALTETTFVNANSLVNDTDVNFFNPGGTDTFIFNGTAADDTIRVAMGEAGGTEFRNTIAGQVVARLEVFNITSAVVRGGDGDDTFSVTPRVGVAMRVEGGDPSGSDVLTLTGAGVPIAVDLAAQAVTETGFGPVSFTGIEVLSIAAAAGDVTILGTAGPDALTVRPTGANDATILGGGPVIHATDIGTFTVNTLGGNDTVIVEGDELNNTIAVSAASVAITGSEAVNLLGQEALEVRGGTGNDTFNVTPGAIPINILGGPPNGQVQQPAGDVLNLVGAVDPVYHQGPELDAGWFTFTGAQPVSFDEIERLELGGLLVVLPDPLEPNNSIATATVLGSLPKITLNDLTIHDATDQDFFQITAQDTGKLVVNLHFLHADGDLDLQIQDRLGNLIASSISTTDDEWLAIPVVGQQRYYIRVYGVAGATNQYDLEIENFPAPVPTLVDLVPASDTGASDTDNLTNDSTPTVLVRVDLRDFANEGIPIDSAPGADVEVTFTSATTGTFTTVNAALVSGANPTLWTATAPALADGLYYVEATVVITDGQGTPAVGRWLFSQPLVLTLDTVAPTGTVPDMLATSDTGAS
ncbi:MAG TPA: LEPR-XLL domain-containing protein, partial [Planctomycetota bacterium]|nr:LEPR-XLL domain-containing protein [Planctomycetota bacterium]